VFYSDNAEGSDALADTGFPTASYANALTLTEVGPEGNNGITYTPLAGQPGFVAGAAGPVTYVIVSDAAVPEPATLTLLGLGAAGFLLIHRRQPRRS
jgi:PEP-CTERM motif